MSSKANVEANLKANPKENPKQPMQDAHESAKLTPLDHGALPAHFITQAIPGIGGVIKQRPEDFLVDEQPQYQPSGSGEHVYIFVQKRGLSTLEMVDIIAKHFRVPKHAIGYAGLKDKHAITRQVVSVHVPGRKPEDFPMLVHDRIEILWSDLHANKLRTGHLKGNRFSIRVRNVVPTSVLNAKRVLDVLAKGGVPNRYGEQRFGILHNNHIVGARLIAGDGPGAAAALLGPCEQYPTINTQSRAAFAREDYLAAFESMSPLAKTERAVLQQLVRGRDPLRAMMSLDNRVVKFFISAAQSAVFNAVLDSRVADGTWATILDGDIAIKLTNGAPFDCDAAVAADPATPARLASYEISPSGPMWGASMRRAKGRVAEVEETSLARLGLTPEMVDSFAKKYSGMMDGSRRAMRVPLIDHDVEGGVDEVGPFVRCVFELPRGSFATVVLHEVMKPKPESLMPAIDGEAGVEGEAGVHGTGPHADSIAATDIEE